MTEEQLYIDDAKLPEAVRNSVAEYTKGIQNEYKKSGSSLPIDLWVLSRDGFYGAIDETKIWVDQIGFGEKARAIGMVRCVGVVLDNGIVCHVGPFGNERMFTPEYEKFRQGEANRRIELLKKLSGENLPQKILIANPNMYRLAPHFHRAFIGSLTKYFPLAEIEIRNANEIGFKDL